LDFLGGSRTDPYSAVSTSITDSFEGGSIMNACPVCGGGVNLPINAVLSELLDCGECSSELEVISLEPVRFVEAPLEAEDWGE
jgi:alpha-aminoadipate carrier protein LysW